VFESQPVRPTPAVRHREVWVKKIPTSDMNPQIQEIWLKKIVPEPYAQQVAVARQRPAPVVATAPMYDYDDDYVVEEIVPVQQPAPRRRYEYVDGTDDASIVAVEEVQPQRILRALPSGIPRYCLCSEHTFV
jgi:hypothetical protein